MKKLGVCWCFIFVFVAFPALGEPKLPIVLNMSFGDSYEVGVVPESDAWIGLSCNDKSCEIRPIRMVREYGEATDVLNDLFKVETLSVEPFAEFAFLGLPLAAGTTIPGYSIFDNSEEQVSALASEAGWRIPWDGSNVSVTAEGNNGERGHSYFLIDGDIKQHVLRDAYDESTPTNVVGWIGDLDGDQKVDVILYTTENGCSPTTILYLSSLRKDNEVMGKAAEFSHEIPACGC